MMSPFFDLIADLHQRPLVDAGVLVRALELHQPVDVDAGLGRIRLVGGADDDTGGVDLIDHAGAARGDSRAGIAGDHAFHAGADERRLGMNERHRLPLHVGAHERAVGVVVLEERNERRRHRNKLLRRHVHEVHLVRRNELHVAGVSHDDEIVGEAALRIDRGIGLRDRVAPFLHRREIDHLVGDAAVLHLAIGRFDEAVFVDAREGRERIDQPDIRPFRRLDRTDAAVVRRVHVAHLEAGALTRKTARPERRQTPLVRDLRQRVGLVHELRELRGAEELAHGSGRRLGVDQILRHHRVDIDRRHALLDRALHPQQPDAVLVLHQLADRAHPAIAEVVDVVDLALAIAQIDQRADHREDVLLAQRAHGVLGGKIEPHVHLHAADRGKIIALGIEEQRVEHGLCGVDRRRLTGTHDAIDVEQRVLARHVLVDRQRVADVGADIDVIDVQERQLLVAGIVQCLQRLLGDLLAGFGVDLAGLRTDEVLGEVVADQFLVGQPQSLEAFLGELTCLAHSKLLAGFEHDRPGKSHARRRRRPRQAEGHGSAGPLRRGSGSRALCRYHQHRGRARIVDAVPARSTTKNAAAAASKTYFRASIWIATKLSRSPRSAANCCHLQGGMDPELWAEQGMSREAIEHQQEDEAEVVAPRHSNPEDLHALPGRQHARVRASIARGWNRRPWCIATR